MSKKEKGFIEKVKNDFKTGVERIINSLKEGIGMVYEKKFLILKFTLLSFLVLLIFGVFPIEYIEYIMIMILFSMSFLIILFHYELFEREIKNKKRFVKNVVFMGALLVLMVFLFSFNPDPDPEISASHPLKIITSALAFLILVMFLFQSIYLIKSGAGPKIALKSAFNFLGRYGMSAMFYIFLLVFLFTLSAIPSIFGSLFVIFSVFFFFCSLYMMFILLYVFWKNAKG
jgi:hypothetical protein